MTSPSPIQDRAREFGRRVVSMLMWSLGVVVIAFGERIREHTFSIPNVYDRMTFYLTVAWFWIIGAWLIYEGGRRVLMDLLNGWREVRAAWRRAND